MKFSDAYPTHQNAIDLLPGWASAMPAGSGLSAGAAEHFNDSRTTWAASALGGFANKSILEIGPFEAYNTYQFQMLGAANVLAVENSEKNFYRCLTVKNIFSLSATFLYGDAILFMEQSKQAFELCWLSGVLYHMTEPVRLLRAAARMADTIFIWTQYYDPSVILADPNQAAFFDPARNQTEIIGSQAVTLHYRSYREAKGGAFSGGADEFSYWMKKDDIFAILRSLGFPHIQMGIDNPAHPSGPACFFLARRG